MSPIFVRRLFVVTLLLAWEVLPRLGWIPQLFLPPFSKAVGAAWSDAGIYFSNAAVTLGEVGLALLIACGGGILLGASIGASPLMRKPVTTMLSALYAVPLIILYPLIAAWVGIGPQSKIAFAAIYGIIPATLACSAGIKSIDPQLSMTAKSLGASFWQRIVHVILPAAIPSVLSGVRIGGALAIVGVVVAEMLASSSGLGFLITSYRTVLDAPRVFAAILFVLAIALAFDALVKFLESKTRLWSAALARR